MTGYTVHTGTSKKFVSGWDKVFGGGSESKEKGKASAKATKKSARKGKKSK